jgi:hypothetical protein
VDSNGLTIDASAVPVFTRCSVMPLIGKRHFDRHHIGDLPILQRGSPVSRPLQDATTLFRRSMLPNLLAARDSEVLTPYADAWQID